MNLTGIAPDDPDANFFENYKCGSPRNYSGYCNPDVDALILEQSQTQDAAERLRLVHTIDKQLQEEGEDRSYRPAYSRYYAGSP